MKAGPIERRTSTQPPTAGGPSAAAQDDPDLVGMVCDSASMALDDPSADSLADQAPTVRTSGTSSTSDGPAQASEAELARWLDALVDRDERALAALYDTTVGRVFGFVKRIVRNDAMAQEVVEDAYFQLWRQAARYDPARGQPMASMARERALPTILWTSSIRRRSKALPHPPTSCWKWRANMPTCTRP
jgi:hypothetical protein